MKLRFAIAAVAATAMVTAPSALAKGTAYVVGGNSNAVGVHSIGPLGGLGAVSAVTTVPTPRSGVITPNGRFLYTTGANADNIGIHSINTSTGALGALGTPVAAGADPEGPAITPNGQFLYVANTGGNSVSGYSINSNTGGLTLLTGFPVALANPNGTAVSPDGANLYVTTDTGVQPYTIDATGAIAANGGLVAAGTTPRAISITPNGRFLYVGNSASNNITGFSVAANGTLTSLGNTASGPTTFGLAITPNGQFLYTANFVNTGPGTTGTSNAFSIGGDGSLTAVTGQPFSTGSEFAYAADAAPNGKLYVANDVQGGAPGTVGQFDIGAAGVLSPITGSPVTTVIAPEFQSIVVSPNQGPTALFTATSPGAGQSSPFDASSSSDPDGGAIVAYVWDFGDGSVLETTTTPTTSHTYATAGNYNVTLTVIDDEGCSNSVIFTGQTADCNPGVPPAQSTQALQVSSTGGTGPDLELTGKKQKLKETVTVKAETADDTDAVAKGTLKIENSKNKKVALKSYDLKKFQAELTAGEKGKLKPKIPSKGFKKAKKALKKGGKVTAKVNVKVTDANSDTEKEGVKVKLTK